MKISKLLSMMSALSLSCVCFAQAVEGPLQVAGNAAAQPAAAPAWVNFALVGGIILFMWLFVFRPQSKRAKEQKDFLASLTPGVEVITTGGIIGTVSEVKENIVSLNIGSSSTVRVLKSAVSGKLNSATELAK